MSTRKTPDSLPSSRDGKIIGYNVVTGGGMGMTPAKKDTFPAVAYRLCFATPDEVVPVAEAIVKVQRDFGNRSDRKLARLKYLIANWGLDQFRDEGRRVLRLEVD